jgi:hypothetical protein
MWTQSNPFQCSLVLLTNISLAGQKKVAKNVGKRLKKCPQTIPIFVKHLKTKVFTHFKKQQPTFEKIVANCMRKVLPNMCKKYVVKRWKEKRCQTLKNKLFN